MPSTTTLHPNATAETSALVLQINMAKVDRIVRRLDALEEAYRATLVEALRDCARGTWGLFGHNEHLVPSSYEPAALDDLRQLADEIATLRSRLDLEPFGLHQRFWAARGRASANAPGEPKQAEAWLADLGEV